MSLLKIFTVWPSELEDLEFPVLLKFGSLPTLYVHLPAQLTIGQHRLGTAQAYVNVVLFSVNMVQYSRCIFSFL